MDCCKVLHIFLVGAVLFITELMMHLFIGSDLSFLYKEKAKNKKLNILDHVYQKIKDVIWVILFIIIFICLLHCCCNRIEINNLEQIRVKIEIPEGSISNDSVITDIRH